MERSVMAARLREVYRKGAVAGFIAGFWIGVALTYGIWNACVDWFGATGIGGP
jgi:hypothetical protein